MQIVIDIPEQMYLNAKADTLCGADILVNAIKNGTPLPKGHGRLIDGDRVIAEATERMKYHANHQFMECVIAHMRLATTIIEADTESEDKG